MEMLSEEDEGAFLGQLEGRRIEAWALVAAETVPGSLVDEDFRVRLRGADRLDVAHRNGGVLIPEMHLHRAERGFVARCGDAAAVPAAGGREEGRARRAPPGDGAAVAISDYPGLLAQERPRGGLHIGQDL